MFNLFLGELHLVLGAKNKNLTPTISDILTIHLFIYSKNVYVTINNIQNCNYCVHNC